MSVGLGYLLTLDLFMMHMSKTYSKHLHLVGGGFAILFLCPGLSDVDLIIRKHLINLLLSTIGLKAPFAL